MPPSDCLPRLPTLPAVRCCAPLLAAAVLLSGCAMMEYNQPAQDDPTAAELTLAWPGPMPPELAMGQLDFQFVALDAECKVDRSFYRAYYAGANGWNRPSNEPATYRTPTPGQTFDATPNRTVRVRTDQPLRIQGRFDRRTEQASGYNQKLVSTLFCRAALEFTPMAGQKYRAVYAYDGNRCGWALAQQSPDGRWGPIDASAKAAPVCRTSAK